jgi:DNA-binding XRE family transcriptional regulator
MRGLLAAPVRLRRPYNKENYSPRASILFVYKSHPPYYIFLFGILQYGIIVLIDMKKSIYTKQYRVLIERLKQARIESGLSQVQAAKALGTTQSHISKAESGQRRIDVIQLKEFAKLYRKEFTYFVP